MWQGFPIRPEQASTIARGVDHLYYFLTAVDLFFTAVIFLTVFYFALRYRRRSEKEKATQVEGTSRSKCYGPSSRWSSLW